MRYAIYFAPDATSQLWHQGCQWLGRDPIGERELAHPTLPNVSALRQFEVTRNARRYGFHATLKAPMHLRADTSVESLSKYAQQWAAKQTAFSITLRCDYLQDFIALRPDDQQSEEALTDLAAKCVRRFEPFRHTRDAREAARRPRAGLSTAQRDLQARWGYPYVFEEYRFHMTLTAGIECTVERANFLAAAKHWFDDALSSPVQVNAIALFEESTPGQPFRVLQSFAFSDGQRHSRE